MLTANLYIAGSLFFLILGFLHVAFTLADTVKPRRLVPFRPEVTEAMKASTLALTKETTMWRAWVGFNLSHGLGLLFFSGTYLLLAIAHALLLRDSLAFLLAAPLMAVAYAIMSFKYWFRIPLIGAILGALCYAVGATAAITT